MIQLSLIQTSQNRKDELLRFVKSMNGQRGIDLKSMQLIFIDQENNKEIFNTLHPNINFVYIKYHHCSLSHARNIGLKYVEGKYIGFPDDDCWYAPNTLRLVLDDFKKGFNGVIAKGINEKGLLTNNSPLTYQRITKYNHCGAISYTIFLIYFPNIKFDEDIGVGSAYKLSSGEETDFLIQTFEAGVQNIIYDPDITVFHPRNNSGNFKNVELKQYEYARGWGYLLKKHNYPISIIVRSFLRPIGGILFSLFSFNTKKLIHSSYILKGRIEGFFFHK